MEHHIEAPPPTIDTTAVELHRPSQEEIERILAQAAQYERSFIYPEVKLVVEERPEWSRRGLGWYACR
jgi:hypothetical protein